MVGIYTWDIYGWDTTNWVEQVGPIMIVPLRLIDGTVGMYRWHNQDMIGIHIFDYMAGQHGWKT